MLPTVIFALSKAWKNRSAERSRRDLRAFDMVCLERTVDETGRLHVCDELLQI